MQIRLVNIQEYAESARELFAANWAETGFDFDLNPDIARYQALQDVGALFALGAFDGDRLVGYSSALVSPSLFNPSVIGCMSDALFVHPDWRNGLAASKLVAATEAEARARGAQLMAWHTRAGTSFAEVFKRRGYVDADIVVMRNL